MGWTFPAAVGFPATRELGDRFHFEFFQRRSDFLDVEKAGSMAEFYEWDFARLHPGSKTPNRRTQLSRKFSDFDQGLLLHCSLMVPSIDCFGKIILV